MQWFLLLALVLLPQSVFATIGFAQESVWLSHTPVIEGETVSIYAALTNGGKDTLTSTAYFRDNGTRIGSLPIELQSGEARIVSISWSPAAGKHSLAVELASSSVELARGTETTTIVVEKPSVFAAVTNPKGSGAASVAFTDSSAIQQGIGKVSPTVETYAKPLFSKLDTWRGSGAAFLDGQRIAAQAKADEYSAKGKEVPSGDSSHQGLRHTAGQMLYTLLVYIYSALQTLLAKAGLFFPLAAFLFFYFLYKVYRRVRGPRYGY